MPTPIIVDTLLVPSLSLPSFSSRCPLVGKTIYTPAVVRAVLTRRRMLLAYTYPAEILKYSQRAKGVVAAQSIGYAFSFLNLYTAPLAIEAIAWRYYAINAGWNVGILAIVIWLFVETKGRTLEEMDELFDGTVHRDGIIVGHSSHTKLRQDESIYLGSLPSGSLLMTRTSTNRS